MGNDISWIILMIIGTGMLAFFLFAPKTTWRLSMHLARQLSESGARYSKWRNRIGIPLTKAEKLVPLAVIYGILKLDNPSLIGTAGITILATSVIGTVYNQEWTKGIIVGAGLLVFAVYSTAVKMREVKARVPFPNQHMTVRNIAISISARNLATLTDRLERRFQNTTRRALYKGGERWGEYPKGPTSTADWPNHSQKRLTGIRIDWTSRTGGSNTQWAVIYQRRWLNAISERVLVCKNVDKKSRDMLENLLSNWEAENENVGARVRRDKSFTILICVGITMITTETLGVHLGEQITSVVVAETSDLRVAATADLGKHLLQFLGILLTISTIVLAAKGRVLPATTLIFGSEKPDSPTRMWTIGILVGIVSTLLMERLPWAAQQLLRWVCTTAPPQTPVWWFELVQMPFIAQGLCDDIVTILAW